MTSQSEFIKHHIAQQLYVSTTDKNGQHLPFPFKQFDQSNNGF